MVLVEGGETGALMPADALLEYIGSVLDQQRTITIADAGQRRELAAICSCLSIPGGTTLFLEGDDPESIYLIVAGMLGLFARGDDGELALVRRMGTGEVVGEIGFLTGEPRSGTVRALRNSELLRISREALDEASSRRPDIARSLCAVAVHRLLSSERSRMASSPPRAICLVPVDATVDIAPFVDSFAQALAPFGKVAIAAFDRDHGRSAVWFADLEKSCDFLLLPATSKSPAWTRFCLQQCDRVLVLANGDSEPHLPPIPKPDRGFGAASIPLDLVLGWRGEVTTRLNARWLELIRPAAHYHVRAVIDIARVARLVFGRGTSLVLSGGGARGLAHVGAIQALREQDVAIDAIGGTSIGAVIGAMHALGWDLAGAASSCVDVFSQNRFTDFALPRIALFSPRKFERTLGKWFGALNIEDTPLPFFCVSTNLSQGKAEIHRSGPMATWLQASTAIPGVFPPVVEKGIEHVDGGVLNNFPVNAACAFGGGPIIGVDVGSDSAGFHGAVGKPGSANAKTGHEAPKMIDLLWRVGTIGNSSADAAGSAECDFVIRPSVAGVKILAWRQRERAVAAGYRAVMENIDAIRSAVGSEKRR
jgi:NTE family protein